MAIKSAKAKWLPCPGFEKTAEVSNLGEVRTVDREIHYQNGKVVRRRGKVISPQKDKRGYVYVNICCGGKNNFKQVHRLVALAFVDGDCSLCVNHKDGDPSNNHFQNLEWLTHSENVAHAVRTGLMNGKGEKNSQAKLTKADVDEIRALRSEGYTLEAIANLFCITFQHVSKICRKGAWA